MNIIVTKNFEEMSANAANIISDVIKAKPDCVLGLATGSTPLRVYEMLTEMEHNGELSFSKTSSINLDEYYPLPPTDPQSYRYFMNKNLFDNITINKDRTYVPNGLAQDVEQACLEYESIIDRLGIDVQILGIGRNGHIGFNEPGSELFRHTHLTDLTQNTIDANARFFDSPDDVPRHAITMGIASVFKAKKIILLASGSGKAEAIAKVVKGNISTDCPASLLCLHSDVTVICDEDAYSMCK